MFLKVSKQALLRAAVVMPWAACVAGEDSIKLSALEVQLPVQSAPSGLVFPGCYKPIKAAFTASSPAGESIDMISSVKLSVSRKPDAIVFQPNEYVIGAKHASGVQGVVGFLPSLAEGVTGMASLLSGVSDNFYTTPFHGKDSMDVDEYGGIAPPKFPICSVESKAYAFNQYLVNGRKPAHSVLVQVPLGRFMLKALITEKHKPMPALASTHSSEFAATYEADWVFAKWQLMAMWGRPWGFYMPSVLDDSTSGAQTGEPSSSTVENTHDVKGGDLVRLGQKISIANADVVTTYSRLTPRASHLNNASSQWFVGADYTFWDALDLGPLTIGAGYVQQSFPYMNHLEHPKGFMLGLNQRLGYYTNLYVFWQHYNVSKGQSPSKPDANTVGAKLTYDIAKMLAG